jgi:putative oxidoreductase
MASGLLLLRLVVGLTLAAHGAQKLFGAFGGAGPRGTAAFFAGLGFRAPLVFAVAAGVAELGGGLLLALGLLTPLASFAVAVVMLNAFATVHRRNGFWNTNKGYEYNLVLCAAAVALAATGAGRFSVDALLGLADVLRGPWWGAVVLVGAAAVSAVIVRGGRVGAQRDAIGREPPLPRTA